MRNRSLFSIIFICIFNFIIIANVCLAEKEEIHDALVYYIAGKLYYHEGKISEAVEEYKQLEQRILQSKSRGTAPNLLGSTNAPPLGPKPKKGWGEASEQEVKDALLHALTNGNT